MIAVFCTHSQLRYATDAITSKMKQHSIEFASLKLTAASVAAGIEPAFENSAFSAAKSRKNWRAKKRPR